MQLDRRPLLVLVGIDKFIADQVRILGLFRLGQDVIRLLRGAALHDEGQEETVLAVDGDHAVGRGALVEDAVALVQDLGMIAHLDLQRTLDDQVKFLPGVGRGVDGLMLLGLGVFIGNPVGRAQLLAEHRRQILDHDAVLLRRDGALAAPGDGIAGELRAVALKQVSQLNAEGQSALMNKGKGQVARALFILQVYIHRHVRPLGHLGAGVADNLSHLPDPAGKLVQFIVDCCLVHVFSPLLHCIPHKKSAPMHLLMH